MHKILGAFEKVSFPELGIFDVIAKVDTGAMSGAVHATSIKKVKMPSGKTAVSFLPFGQEPRMQVADYKKTFVTSSNGETEERYVLETKVMINDKEYPIKISLSDRTAMKKGVLIGRRFLREQNFLVDSNLGHEYRYERKD